ncbi:MAG: ABC transporter substrate-binding protein, partial [Dehalococcoidales bacterium]|nr:ABC transporter substrate-binding protein [Dehalococcoidales bacterium]
MAKKIVWIMISCLMVLSLVLASCDSGDTETGTVTTSGESQKVSVGTEGGEGGTTTVESSRDTAPEVSVPKDESKPQYGGTLTILAGSDITTWNPGAATCQSAGQGSYALEQILGIAFDKGPAGSGETNFIGGVADYRYLGGNIAESWETPEVGVWVLNIHPGIHFYNHPDQEASKLVGGRELKPEDVAYSIEYMRDNPVSSSQCSEPSLISNTTCEITGDWQVTVRTPVAPGTGYLWIMGGGGVQYVWPKEFLEAYATSNNWYDVVGTGPVMLDDYVQSSVARYIRNDNYWDINPVGPGKGDQLPYISKLNYQIIPDYSTRLAALRTGKADWSYVDVLEIEDYQTIVRSNPDIKAAQTIIAPQQVSGRVDLDGPFSKLKVRQAMMLAIDHPTIVRDLYDGQAELIDSPARKWYTTIHTPLEELPAETQEYYGYNPEKAKQLLSEAGYPDGFKIKMVMQNGVAQEEASAIIQEYWRAVGIDCELQLL